MSKIADYREQLKSMDYWDDYLIKESRLPGPRANLELAYAVAEEGSPETFERYKNITEVEAPYGSALEFLTVCGVLGLGRLLAEGHSEILNELRFHASDSRWRVREAVAMALQRFGDQSLSELLEEMEKWSQGSLLERRAAIAALCEPRLLKNPETALKVLNLLNRVTDDIHNEDLRRVDEFITLRKALGYCWSVAVVASPEAGKKLMDKWLADNDKDIQWIMKENLNKNRLKKLVLDWQTT